MEIHLLKTQLRLLNTMTANQTFNTKELITYFKSMKITEKTLLSEVIIIAKLMIVMPAINAVSERSYSTLKWTKTYLRSTMLQERLNHLMLLHIHKDRVDSIDIINIANEFVSKTVIANTPSGYLRLERRSLQL